MKTGSCFAAELTRQEVRSKIVARGGVRVTRVRSTFAPSRVFFDRIPAAFLAADSCQIREPEDPRKCQIRVQTITAGDTLETQSSGQESLTLIWRADGLAPGLGRNVRSYDFA